MNFAVFASGFGSNLQAIIDAVARGEIKADLKLVLSDKKNSFALERAQKAGIPTVWIDPKQFQDRASFDAACLKELKKNKIDFIALAGYMRILSPGFIKAYSNKIINIHPAYLPAFKGANAIKDAFAAKVKETGVTVHFVVEEVDSGPIILQEKLLIEPQDTLESLEKRVHALEHKLYPKAIALFVDGKIKNR